MFKFIMVLMCSLLLCSCTKEATVQLDGYISEIADKPMFIIKKQVFISRISPPIMDYTITDGTKSWTLNSLKDYQIGDQVEITVIPREKRNGN